MLLSLTTTERTITPLDALNRNEPEKSEDAVGVRVGEDVGANDNGALSDGG